MGHPVYKHNSSVYTLIEETEIVHSWKFSGKFSEFLNFWIFCIIKLPLVSFGDKLHIWWILIIDYNFKIFFIRESLFREIFTWTHCHKKVSALWVSAPTTKSARKFCLNPVKYLTKSSIVNDHIHDDDFTICNRFLTNLPGLLIILV